MTQTDPLPGSGEEAVMKKSVITADFEVKERVPAVFTSRHAVERMKEVIKKGGMEGRMRGEDKGGEGRSGIMTTL